jgi:hypothetical protein
VPHTFFAVTVGAPASTLLPGIDVAVAVLAAISTTATADSDPHDPDLTLRLHAFTTIPQRTWCGR